MCTPIDKYDPAYPRIAEENKKFEKLCYGIACACVFVIIVMGAGAWFHPPGTRFVLVDDGGNSWSSSTSYYSSRTEEDEPERGIVLKKEFLYQIDMLKTRMEWGMSQCTKAQLEFFTNLTSQQLCFRNEAELNITCQYNRKLAQWGISVDIYYETKIMNIFIDSSNIMISEPTSHTMRVMPLANESTVFHALKTIDEIYLVTESDYLCCAYFLRRGLPTPLYCQ